MEIVFATHNANKAKEIQSALPPSFRVLTLSDLGFYEDIPETADTLEDNALIKARTIWEKFGLPCFADDTGLEVDALHGKPGVLSARYAGEEKNDEANLQKLLIDLDNISDRTAQFRTNICYIFNGNPIHFEGVVRGQITTQKVGEQGFGYDPIFRPDGFDRTFAEMSLQEKHGISHRGKAFNQLIKYLQTATR